MKKLLSFLALALCFVACQNDAVESVNNSDLANVVLTIDAPELGVTRADGDTLEDGTRKNGKNSAFGAIDFLSDADWDNYDLRYILEVYKAGDEGTGEPIYRERLVNCLDKYAPTTFDLRVVPNRKYKFVVFADFVAEGSAEAEDKLAIADLYYNTADLRNISAITDQPTWNAMNEIRDAYFISKDVEVTTGLQETLTLTRPFAKLRVITTDIDYINGYSTPGYVEVTYKDEPIYKSFNAVNGMLNKSNEMKDSELTYGFEVNKNIPYTEGYDALASHQTLFADYLFAVEGEQTAVNFEMKVYESKGGNLIHAQDFSTQIPIQRNYLTTIIGDLLTTQANITIKIDDNFIDEWVNPKMKVEPTVLATPAVKAEVKENVVTLTWEAVENAAQYGITVGTEMPVFVEGTTYAFTGEYETEYTFNVVAVPADEDKFEVSEAATVTATTEAAPVELGYKLYFHNVAEWSKVYAHIWANEGEDLGLEAVEWPGRELTETEELDGVTYYVFQLPAEATGKTVNVVFNDGAGTQTKDLAGVVEGNLFFDNYVEPVAPSDVVLYLQPNKNWNIDGARFAAYFFGNGETWVDMTLVEGETNIYAVTVPTGFENIIFCRMNPGAAANNWNNKWNQTADLKVPTDGTNLYTVNEDTWDNGGGEWSVYAPAVEPEEPTAHATTVEATMKSFGWDNAAVIKDPFKLDDNVSVTVAQNTAGTAPTYYTNGEALRLYQNGATMTVTANGKTIKAIEFTFNGNYTYLETATPTYADGTWTGEATEVTFSTPKSSDKAHRAYISAIKVTYVD